MALTRLAVFAGIWLTVGFTTGTSTLLGPVRWLTDYARSHGWSESQESLAVRTAIVLYVLASAAISVWLARAVLRTRLRHVRYGIPALCALAAAATVGLWLSPGLMGAALGAEIRVGRSFTFGPYATEERMQRLKREGYTGVVSLLHPIVAPFETKLIADGAAAAERVGIEYIHVPMLPWVGDNTASIERLAGLAARAEGRYYVHCYLGKDRVRVARRVIEQTDPTARVATTKELSAHAAARSLRDVARFERGDVLEVARDVFLTPFPTDDEFMSYVLPGTHGHVVSLLDPASEMDRPWIDKERELLAAHRLRYESRPLSVDNYDPERTLAVAREVREMDRPLVVHAFLGLESGRAPTVEGFLQAFRSDRPPLPPSLFVEPMDGAKVEIIAPNVAVGPRPSPARFGDYLAARGVREFVYVAPVDDAVAREDAGVCAERALSWRRADAAALAGLVSGGGPWYLYGPSLDGALRRLAADLGPAIPAAAEEAPAETLQDALSGRRASIPELLQSALPEPRTAILLAPLLALVAGLAAALAGWLRVRRDVRTPYTRKVFHFIIFTLAGVVHVTVGFAGVALFGSIVALMVLYAVARGEGFAFYEALARPTDAPRRTLFVLVPLATTAIGGLGANLLFGGLAHVGYLVCGWGDAVAEPVGTRWGRHRYRVPSIAGVAATRSLEGSTAVFLVGGLAAFAGLLLAGVPAATAAGVALACAAAGALVEALSNHGLDNLTVQLAAAGTAWLFLG